MNFIRIGFSSAKLTMSTDKSRRTVASHVWISGMDRFFACAAVDTEQITREILVLFAHYFGGIFALLSSKHRSIPPSRLTVASDTDASILVIVFFTLATVVTFLGIGVRRFVGLGTGNKGRGTILTRVRRTALAVKRTLCLGTIEFTVGQTVTVRTAVYSTPVQESNALGHCRGDERYHAAQQKR
jgi:hypothetical protein